MENVVFVTAIIGAVSGVVGTILGIINICHALSTSRVRLKVLPKIAFMIDRGNAITVDRPTDRCISLLRDKVPYKVCVQVTNLSTFPLTISDVGFGNIKETRGIIFAPELTPGKTWPARLESRESITAYARIGETLDPKVLKKPVAYARTDCGKVKYGTSHILKAILKYGNREN